MRIKVCGETGLQIAGQRHGGERGDIQRATPFVQATTSRNRNLALINKVASTCQESVNTIVVVHYSGDGGVRPTSSANVPALFPNWRRQRQCKWVLALGPRSHCGDTYPQPSKVCQVRHSFIMRSIVSYSKVGQRGIRRCRVLFF